MKIITAIGNPEINEELNKDNFYEVIGVDIQYQDGVFEILQENKNIDYLILNLNIIGELNKFDFIEKIIEENNNLNLIIILEKENEKLIRFLTSKNIKNILLKNKNNLNEINDIIKNKKEINLINDGRKNLPQFVGVGHFLSSSIQKKSATPVCGYFIPKNKTLFIFNNKKINKKSLIILLFKLINKKILIIEFINNLNNNEIEKEIKINKKINLIKCNIESLNRSDLKNKFNNYDFIVFNLFNIKEKNKIIEIINLIF